EFRNIGYLIVLWGSGRRILRELDIDTSVSSVRGFEYTADVIFDKHGGLMQAVPLAPFRSLGPTVVIKRTDLHTGLFELLRGVDVRFNRTVVSYFQHDGQVSVELTDGTKDTFDLVIGAYGVHSSVREQVFGSNFLHYYGWGAWMWWMANDNAHPNE